MKMLKLTRVTGRMVDTDHPEGEDDGLSNVTEFPRQEETTPVILDATQVRNFYPRKGGRPGTRILFRNGSALPVTETFDEVEQKIREALAA